MKRQWWLVAVMMLLCAAQAPAQSDAAARDSVLQASLDSMFVNPLVRLACVAAHANPDSTSFSVDSMVAQTAVTRCDGYRGAVAFVRDTTVDDKNVHFLNNAVLQQQPKFWMMCGMKQVGTVLCDLTERRP